MRRGALQDPLTDTEMQECTEIIAKYNLYTVLNAAFAMAQQEGLELNVDLKRPRERARRGRRK